MMHHQPTTVVFDVGNVLIEWDPRHLYRRVFDGDETKMNAFMSKVVTGAWNVEQDRGRSFEEGIALLVQQFPEWEAEIKAFDLRWHEMVPGAIEANVDLLAALNRAGTPTYAITNFSREKWAESVVRFPFLNAFAGAVVSAHEGVIKPDPRIYQRLAERYDLDLGQCVFIDDSARNIDAASALGMTTIHYTGAEVDVAAELRGLGFAF
jgi:2-haloacid dehalogenase